ncbi:MAG: hypothetical protein AAF797_11015 [Planctomycetota bacterium]
MTRFPLILALPAVGLITVATLTAQPQAGSGQAQPANTPTINTAADKAAARQQAKQAAANRPVGVSTVSIEKPITFPDDI